MYSIVIMLYEVNLCCLSFVSLLNMNVAITIPYITLAIYYIALVIPYQR